MDSSYHLEPASEYTDSAQDVSAMDQYLQEQPSDEEEETMTTEEQREKAAEEVVQGAVQEQQVEEERVGETSEEKAMKLKQYADVFGGDSDLSDVSDGDDDDDSENEAPLPSKARAKPIYREEEPDEDDEESSDDDDDLGARGGDGEYRAEVGEKESASDKIKALSIKKKKKTPREEGEGEDEEPKKKKKKTKARVEDVEEPEEIIDPEAARRRAVNARIDAIVKKPKGKSAKKTRGQQDDDLEAMNDEAIVKLRIEMMAAADHDIEDNLAGKYAINKLRMLPRVVEIMQKSTLADSLVENGLLDAVKQWLEPLNDGSLPAVNIQRPLFEMLRNLPIDTGALRACGIGKIVYFYTKCKRVEPTIARMANQLVADWMRPIIRNSKSLADRAIESVEDEPIPGARVRTSGSGSGSASQGGSRSQKQASQGVGMGGRSENEGIARRHARIPEMLTANFKVAPMRDAKDRNSGNGMSSSNVAVGVKMKTYKKKLLAGQQASRRV